MDSSTASLGRKLDGAPPVLPPISPLIDRRKLHPAYFEPVAESLEKGGFSVGWNDGSLQVGGSLAQSGLSSPTNGSTRSAYRPRTSGFLSFSKAPGRGHRAANANNSTGVGPTAAPVPDAPLTPQPTRRQRTPHPRFSRLGASLDSATANSLLAIAQSHINDAIADPDQRRLTTTSQPALDAADGASEANIAKSTSGSGRTTTPPTVPTGSSSRPSASVAATAGSSVGGGASTTLLSTAKVASTLGINVPAENLRDSERPATGIPTRGPVNVIQVPLGVPSPRSHQAQVAAFKASRGHALMVFNELDSDKNGKVTRSEFEAAALSLGFSLEQAQRFWERLDRRHRGFLEALDWGTKDAFQQIQLFSTRYMQKYMGVPDLSSSPEQVRKYVRSQELMQVKSLAAAINMVRANAVARAMRSTGSSGNPIFETFRFMDLDSSGLLSKEEIRDAFFALGVFLSESVVDQIIQLFDKDGNGTVQYHEFETTMFPPVRGT